MQAESQSVSIPQAMQIGWEHHQAGRLPEAECIYQQVLQVDPNHPEALHLLGLIAHQVGKNDVAVQLIDKALTIKPDYAEALSDRGVVLYSLNRLDEAIASYDRALTIKPDYAEALNNRGAALGALYRYDEAEASYHRALRINPEYPEAHNNLGSLFGNMGWLEEAIASFRRALELKPEYAEAHSNLIFTLDMSTSEDIASLQAERKVWSESYAMPLFVERAFSNTLDPDRRLRIGYVSADFRGHSAARAFESMLFHFDRQHYEIYAYSNNHREDTLTQRFKQNVTGWRKIAGLPDDAVANLIRQDQIDILVDLSGHSAGHRLLVFARKPAPIQITAWGHATGTGVKAIDVFLADAVIVPPEERSLYAETVRYLPCALCYSSDATPPPVNVLPALQQPGITFGSFNRLSKVSDPTITLWSRVLQAIPDSRLILKTPELDDDATREHVLARLARAGIEAARVTLQGKTNWDRHMAAYHQIDIALDPFPQGGGITTLEGLLMGVPAITLRWPTVAGRISATVLTTLSLTDWIAETEDDYVQLAIDKAHSIEALAVLRSTLRERFKESVLGNANDYVKIVEKEYRDLWRAWAQKQIEHDPKMAAAPNA